MLILKETGKSMQAVSCSAKPVLLLSLLASFFSFFFLRTRFSDDIETV